jgi:hypothetical protein
MPTVTPETHEIVQYLNVRDPEMADEVRARILRRDASTAATAATPEFPRPSTARRVLQSVQMLVGGIASGLLTAYVVADAPRRESGLLLLLVTFLLLGLAAALDASVLRTSRQRRLSAFVCWAALVHFALGAFLLLGG